ncbi:MAG: hypothetical protein JJ900_00460 [Rhodospirillales bacterium]|nr:hypothetical protein [Rhodospirillales bacterium]MBO6785288.1 hypothetical protein [Rhodospirillales bacterium]
MIALGLAIAAAIGLAEKLLQISKIWPVAYERLPDGHLLLIYSLVSGVAPMQSITSSRGDS